jgi:UDP-N-acetylglucosamine 2-epimerase
MLQCSISIRLCSRHNCRQFSNPYGEPGASERVVAVLRDHPLRNIRKKSFYMPELKEL